MPYAKVPLSWDASSSRYRASSTGRFIARSKVVEAVDLLVEDTREYLRGLSQMYTDGKIDLGDWQSAFKDRLRAAHTLSAGIALGGKENISQAEWGRIGALTREQYGYLQGFAVELEQGKQIHFGRVDLYARAIRATFLNAERIRMAANQKARWVLHAKESCAGVGSCREQASRGKQLVRDFPLIGSRICLHNCHCELELSN